MNESQTVENLVEENKKLRERIAQLNKMIEEMETRDHQLVEEANDLEKALEKIHKVCKKTLGYVCD
jgi:cell division protein FtsB